MTPVILSHIFALGYGWFFVDALMVMLLAAIYLSLTRGDDGRRTNAQKILGRTN
jgi:hypothetical protein